MKFRVGDTWRTRHGLLVNITEVSENEVIGTFSPNLMHITEYHYNADGTYYNKDESLYDLVEIVL